MTLTHQKSWQQVRSEWQAHLHDNATLLQSNDAPSQQLHFLASLYFGYSRWAVGESAQERLRRFLDDDGLTTLALDALARVPGRSDLPGVQEVLQSAARNRMPFLAWPMLAGLREGAARAGQEALSDDRLRTALAIYAFYDPVPHETAPQWHQWAVMHRPQVVAETIVAVYKAVLQTTGSRYYGLYELAHDSAYVEVARLTVPSLLRAFPTRARAEQLAMLTLVLAAALLHCEEQAFCAIVDRKLAAKSMGARQKMHWVCAGLLRRPAAYLSQLKRELEGGASQRRVRYAAEFLGRDGMRHRLAQLDHVGAVGLLLGRLGRDFGPFGVVPTLIDAAAKCPDADATALLQALIRDPALVRWREGLEKAARAQRELRRNTEFRFPPPRDVMEALAGGTPADARDLAALAHEEIATLGRSIRDGQTSDWRQYWRTECDPQAENDCRDRLLSDLAPRLRRFSVGADQEPTYADDKRPDIRISCGGFNVPIEVKRSNSKDLWSAIRCQLVPKYSRDPGAAGHGIFLVFWFGQRLCQPSETGRRPVSAAALQALLVESVPTELSGQIKVLVIDVSRPDSVASRDR